MDYGYSKNEDVEYYKKRLDEALFELADTQRKLILAKAEAASHWATIEDLACGAGIQCPDCGKQRPCLCQDAGKVDIEPQVATD
jgi:hypothetical protein